MQTETGVRIGSRAYRASIWDSFRDADGKVLCANCGHITGKLADRIHHPVPINNGGYDVPSNCQPLCYECHKLAHELNMPEEFSRRIRVGKAKSNKKDGRPRSCPENYKELLNDYVFCRIGKKELSRRWGVFVTSRKDTSVMQPVDMVKLCDKIWYKDYLKELGIAKVENHVDYWQNLRSERGDIKVGEYVGTITYIDGRVEDLYKQAI